MAISHRPTPRYRQKTTAYVKPHLAFLAVVPALVLITLLSIFPAVVNILMSLTNYDGVRDNIRFVFLDNYVNFFRVYGHQTLPALYTTFRYMGLMIIPIQVIAFTAAILVNTNLKGRNFFRSIFFMPTILGIAVVSASWRLMFDPIDGPFARLLSTFGRSSGFLGSDQALLYVAAIALWAGFGYIMVIYLAGLAGIDRELYEAAQIDGGTKWQIFQRITLPLMWPVITINLWISLNGTLQMSEYIIFTTRGQFGTKTFAYYIFESVIENQVSQGQSAATSIYFSIFITVIMLLFNKYVRSKELY